MTTRAKLSSLAARLRAWLVRREAARRHARWRRWHEDERACRIHPSVELRDETPATPANLALGRQTTLERDITFWLGVAPDAAISLGARVYVGRNCYLGALAPLRIGDDTLIGAYCYLITANHAIADLARPVRDQGYTTAPIVIGCDVWLGAHVTILPGVTIGDQAVVGAGAVVTKSIGPREIWAGVPAKKIGERGSAAGRQNLG